MKSIILLFSVIPTFVFSQIEIIESIQLDSLIFMKINEYRTSKGVDHFLAFEDSLMRDFSYQLTRENSAKKTIEHSTDNKYQYYNVECIYSFKRYGSSNSTEWFLNQINSGNYEEIAEKVVKAWISSPSHENGISNPDYYIATVTSRITLNTTDKVGKVVVSYHGLSKCLSYYNYYVYHE